MKSLNWISLISVFMAGPVIADSNPQINILLSQYQAAGGSGFSADAGKALWTRSFNSARAPQSRACTSCHTANLRDSGKHIRTKKAIKPLARSANPESLAELKKINKWFKRNCKWTMGRECTAQEKGDILTYLKEL